MDLHWSFLGAHCAKCRQPAERVGGECQDPTCDCHSGRYVHIETGLEDCTE